MCKGEVSGIFNRACLLLGDEAMNRIAEAKVIVFGVGGVGSWCAESLVRSGVSHLTIVDSDRVSVSNINRQLMATTATIGEVKVEALKRHLLLINPDARIEARQQYFCEETAAEFDLDNYDYIVDCIDSLKDKALLIETATRTKARFFSSMGAALKLDPTRVKVGEFRTVKGCPLARALRNRFKRSRRFPAKKFLCVYSDELLENKGGAELEEDVSAGLLHGEEDSAVFNGARSVKARINGSLMHITSMFGVILGGLIIESIVK